MQYRHAIDLILLTKQHILIKMHIIIKIDIYNNIDITMTQKYWILQATSQTETVYENFCS